MSVYRPESESPDLTSSVSMDRVFQAAYSLSVGDVVAAFGPPWVQISSFWFGDWWIACFSSWGLEFPLALTVNAQMLEASQDLVSLNARLRAAIGA